MIYRSILKVVFAIAECSALLFVGLNPSSAQESSVLPKVGDSVTQYFRVPLRDGEFRKSSSPGIQSIACITISKPGDSPPPPSLGYNNCLRLGDLKLGMEFYRLQIALTGLKTIPEQYITNPRVVDKSEEVLTVLIPISTTQSGNQVRMQSYLVVLLDKKGLIQGLQLTGKPSDTASSLQFSSIALGDSKDGVLDILGFPSSVSNVPEIHGKLWSYSPFPFTIEFVNNAVYSVRIDRPSENSSQKAFIPLSSMPE